ncbi:MAG: hypothetical protein K2Y18_03900 [Alphaproteobacteria bacterium]|jgi:hypothetical protein|nr:hypothetical protein [Alphaproteobacteria bacterium]
MPALAHQLSYTSRDASQEDTGVLRTLKKKVRERFSRVSKPVGHLGGASPENHKALKDHLDPLDWERDLEYWPKKGSTHEDMEIQIG